MQCTSCGFANQAGMKFCTECGTRLANRCGRCNFENPLPAKFCGECGQALMPQVVSSPQLTDRATPDCAVSRTGGTGLQPVPTERQPVAAEILYQRGILPNAECTFKHALIQDAAYQSLLKSKRQHYHEQIAQTLAAYVSVSGDIHPELLAHHYTQAGLKEEALSYWYQAGERAVGQSANEEAVRHLQTGLALLDSLPASPQHQRHESAFRSALRRSLMAARAEEA